MLDQRLSALQQWIIKILSTTDFNIIPITGDASFRRYFRVQLSHQTFIAMDAPPEKENILPFIAIATAFANLTIHVPHIHASDTQQGFMLLSDLGDDLYLNVLNPDNVDHLYNRALNTLECIQTCTVNIPNWPLPFFNVEHIYSELQLFPDWFLTKHLELTLTPELQNLLVESFNVLIQSATEQPQVCIHRDYHSRNLLVLPDEAVGVLDFQDAMLGPITYDLVSLLRDCYIAWPITQVEQWVFTFYEKLKAKSLIKTVGFEEFLRWFDLMGLQRHIKVLGIFARLSYRDNKHNHLSNTSRILNYVLIVSEKYAELKSLHQFFNTIISERLSLKQAA